MRRNWGLIHSVIDSRVSQPGEGSKGQEEEDEEGEGHSVDSTLGTNHSAAFQLVLYTRGGETADLEY